MIRCVVRLERALLWDITYICFVFVKIDSIYFAIPTEDFLHLGFSDFGGKIVNEDLEIWAFSVAFWLLYIRLIKICFTLLWSLFQNKSVSKFRSEWIENLVASLLYRLWCRHYSLEYISFWTRRLTRIKSSLGWELLLRLLNSVKDVGWGPTIIFLTIPTRSAYRPSEKLWLH